MLKYVKVMNEEDLPPGKSAIIAAGKEEIALFNYKGKYYAIANKCLHRGSPLGEGRIVEGILICPNHEWRYDLKTGDCPQNPELRTKVYPVRVVAGKIRIGLELDGRKKGQAVGKAPATLPKELNFTIPTIQKPRNPDEEL